WKESQRTAAGHHRDALKSMCKSADMGGTGSGTDAELEQMGLKSSAEVQTLRTQINEHKAALARSEADNKALVADLREGMKKLRQRYEKNERELRLAKA